MLSIILIARPDTPPPPPSDRDLKSFISAANQHPDTRQVKYL